MILVRKHMLSLDIEFVISCGQIISVLWCWLFFLQLIRG